jgi:hypothetical protein
MVVAAESWIIDSSPWWWPELKALAVRRKR